MRASGILMHISSLPNNYGIGKMGKEAYAFADFLKVSKNKSIGRFFLYHRQAMVIHHIKVFQFMQATHIL